MAGHRYWRFTLDATTPANVGYTLSEVQFRITVGVPLTPSGGTPSAGDTYEGNLDAFVDGVSPRFTYGPDKACDGDLLTIWSSNGPTQPQWWAYDYGPGNAPTIVEMAITARAEGYANQTPTKVTPGWSDDGVNWTSFDQVTLHEWAEHETQAFALPSTEPPSVPETIPGLALWIDASQDAFADGASIPSYVEHSPHHRVFTAPAGAEPTFRANVDGRPRIEFHNSTLIYPNFSPSDEGMTYVMFNRNVEAISYGMMIVYSNAAATGNGYEFRLSASGRFLNLLAEGQNLEYVADYVGGGPNASIPYLETFGVDYLNYADFSQDLINIYINNELITTRTGVPWAARVMPMDINIAGRQPDLFYAHIIVAEALVYDGVLSADDRTRLYDYLIAKWNPPPVVYVDFAGNIGSPCSYGKLSYGRAHYSSIDAFASIFKGDIDIVGSDYFDGDLRPVVAFAGALSLLPGLAGDLAPVVSFAGDLSLIPYANFAGNLTPAVTFTGDLTFVPFVDFAGDLAPHQVTFTGELSRVIGLAGDLAPQIDLQGLLGFDLPLTADGSFGFTVVYAASSMISGPLWGASTPCPAPPWGPSETCPPPLWTPADPCDPVDWEETELCNG